MWELTCSPFPLPYGTPVPSGKGNQVELSFGGGVRGSVMPPLACTHGGAKGILQLSEQLSSLLDNCNPQATLDAIPEGP